MSAPAAAKAANTVGGRTPPASAPWTHAYGDNFPLSRDGYTKDQLTAIGNRASHEHQNKYDENYLGVRPDLIARIKHLETVGGRMPLPAGTSAAGGSRDSQHHVTFDGKFQLQWPNGTPAAAPITTQSRVRIPVPSGTGG
jgi:hypothetical protein